MNPFRIFTRSKRPDRAMKASHAPVAKVVHVETHKRPSLDDDLHRQLAAEVHGTVEDRARRAGA